MRRRPAVRLRLMLLLLTAQATLPVPASVDTASLDQAAAAAQARAQARGAEADRLAAARVDAAATLRATEDQLTDMNARIATLQTRREAASRAAEARATRLAPLLPLATRLGLYPAATLLSMNESPEDAVRGVLVLQGLAQQLAASMGALAAERDQAAAASRMLAALQSQQAAAVTRQQDLAKTLDMELATAARLRDEARDAATEAARHVALAAAQAASLKAAVATLDAARKPRSARRIALSPGRDAAVPIGLVASAGWSLPVAGRISGAFAAPTDAGPASGLTFEAPAGARVVVPCPGRVVFAGPFRSYGQMVIVQCGGGLHVVMAGLGRLDAAVGQAVRGGEPVGVMAGSGGPLYLELRRAGVAVDPTPYLRQKG